MAAATAMIDGDSISQLLVSVVLPAAGTGQRAATPTPKQVRCV